MVKKAQNRRAEMPEIHGGSSGRNLRDKPEGVSIATAMEETAGPGTKQLMEAVVVHYFAAFVNLSNL